MVASCPSLLWHLCPDRCIVPGSHTPILGGRGWLPRAPALRTQCEMTLIVQLQRRIFHQLSADRARRCHLHLPKYDSSSVLTVD